MEIGRMLGRITRAAGTALDIDSHAGLAAATPQQRTARGDEKSNHAKRAANVERPLLPRNSTFTTKLRFCTSAFRRGVDIESWKSAGKRRRTPELKIQICITNLRSRLFNPTPNITNSHLHLCADDDSLPAEVWAVVRGARGSAARCRQREALGLCSVSSISIRSAAGPAVPASPFV